MLPVKLRTVDPVHSNGNKFFYSWENQGYRWLKTYWLPWMVTYSALTPGTLTLVALSSNYVLESHREKEELVQFQWQIQIRELRNTRIKSGSTIFSPFSIRCTVSVLDSKASVLSVNNFLWMLRIVQKLLLCAFWEVGSCNHAILGHKWISNLW